MKARLKSNCPQLTAALSVVLLSIACASRLNAESWVDLRVFGPFVCRADFSLAGQEYIFRDLADIQRDLISRLEIPAADERVELYLFRSRAAYQAYLRKWFPNVPFRRALYVKNNGPGMVLAFQSSELATDMRHECTHALLHAALPMVPLWLDEGLAEYYEVAPEERANKNPHFGSLIWNLRFGQVPQLRKLEAKRDLSEMGRSEYRNAWAWAHFMLHGPPQVRRELVRFLSDIRAGTPPGQLSSRLQRLATDPERVLVHHFKTFDR